MTFDVTVPSPVANRSMRRHLAAWISGLTLVLTWVTGCRGRAHEDLYQQKLIREVRTLEDQLYEADYENRVLADKLRRTRQNAAGSGTVTSPRQPLFKKSSPGPQSPKPAKKPAPAFENIPAGEPFDLGAGLEDSPPEQTTPSPKSTSPKSKQPSPEDFDPDTMVNPGWSVPPREPTPPGRDDLKFDPIEPGKILPPNSPSGTPDRPPGQITLPPGLGMLGDLGPVAGSEPKIVLRPAKLAIDESKTRPVFDYENPDNRSLTLGLDLVLEAKDQYGHPIALFGRTHDPLDQLRRHSSGVKSLPMYDLDPSLSLSVVALDATKKGDDAKLGRWDFDADKLRSLERIPTDDGTGDALKLPIRWKDARPGGENVVVFARMQSKTQDLRCESELALTKPPSIAGWLPRGEKSKR